MNLFSSIANFFSPSTKTKPLNGLSGMELADALLCNLVTEDRVPGISTTILKEGRTLLQKGYGLADIDNKVPIDPKQTIFRIASISKCITGLALGKMIEDGILDFDDSFYKHVPYYPKKKFEFTLRQLAGHTAGIRGYRGKEFAMNEPYSIKDGLDMFKNDPLLFEPGKGYLYNSFDFVLLSLAMQEASGEPFEAYVHKNVLAPLEMHQTFAKPSQVDVGQRSQNYTKTSTGFKRAITVNNFYKLAGGGYLSTSVDIAKLGQAVLERKLLKPETYKELLTAQTVNGKSTYYGLGFQVSRDSHGKNFVGHVGSSVAAYTNLFVYPEEQLVIAILIHCTDPKVQERLDLAINAFTHLHS
ncbi:serine hydrolase domain-containing protein [Croceitalea sp. MTPC5]|nr:serine hydrolase domain-containing protein [Croceitalea sp. MTPC5]